MIPVFIDTYNLHYVLQSRFGPGSRTILYDNLFKYFTKTYNDELSITAYVQRTEHSFNFVRHLQDVCGAFVKCRKIRNRKAENFDVDLALDTVIGAAPRVIICSSSPNLIPLLRRLSDSQVTTFVHSVGIPAEFRNYATVREIGGDSLAKGKEEPNEPVATAE